MAQKRDFFCALMYSLLLRLRFIFFIIYCKDVDETGQWQAIKEGMSWDLETKMD